MPSLLFMAGFFPRQANFCDRGAVSISLLCAFAVKEFFPRRACQKKKPTTNPQPQDSSPLPGRRHGVQGAEGFDFGLGAGLPFLGGAEESDATLGRASCRG